MNPRTRSNGSGRDSAAEEDSNSKQVGFGWMGNQARIVWGPDGVGTGR